MKKTYFAAVFTAKMLGGHKKLKKRKKQPDTAPLGLDSMTLECYNSKAVKKNTLQQSEEQTTQRGTAVAAKAGKDLGFSILLDYYGMVLTEKQRNILTEYYNDDLSLAEIAENYGITRQEYGMPSSMAKRP